MISELLFLTCAVGFILPYSSGTPATRGQSWAYSKDPLSYLSDEYSGGGRRLQRGASEEENTDFEESVDDYPADTIRQLLSQNPSLTIYFQKKKIPSFGRRHNSFDQAEDKGMCVTSFNTKWPQKLANRKGMMKFIVNLDSSYQPVYVETCKKNSNCALKEFFPLEYQSQCKQKYSTARLVVLDNATEKTFAVDEFDIPCGCVCTIRKT